MTNAKTSRKSLVARMAMTLSVAAAALVATAVPSSAAAVAVTATPATGAQGATISLVSKTATTFKSGSTINISNTATPGTIDPYAVLFQTATCPTTSTLSLVTEEVTGASPYTLKAQSVTIVSGSKVVVKAPATMAAGAYNVCVYNNAANGSKSILATSKFTVFAAPTVTSVSPDSGPALGGQAITITGTNFTSKTTATLGGVALPVKLATGSTTTLTATTPARAPGDNLTLAVTTEGGTASTTYSYLDGISVVPNTMVGNDDSSTEPVVLDITGAGFNDFDNLNAAVYLVQAASWNQATPNDKGICANIIVLSDLELICTVDPADDTNAAGAETPNGSYQVVVTADKTDAGARQTLITSGSAFTVAPY